jgi:hypothetical protein
VAMVNSQAPRQACLDGHMCSVRAPRPNRTLSVPKYETVSHYSDTRSLPADSGENGIDLRAARKAGCLPDNRSRTVEDDHRGRTDDAQPPHQIQVRLGIDVDVGDAVASRGDVAQQRPRRPARTAEGTGELHQGGVGSELGADLISGQAAPTFPRTKASVRERRHASSVRAIDR